ncbi:MAG: TonB-dependent receptor [Candidatus Acidiferrum sp.]|jgi:hypothetical protein
MNTLRHMVMQLAVCLAGICLLLASGERLHAQNSRGTILGHVTDASGAGVRGAKVALRNVSTDVSSVFETNSAGDFVFVNVVPGTYEITVEDRGFATEHTTGLVLEVDQTLRQDYQLKVGAINEKVEIIADTQMVQTDNTTLGNVIDQRLIEDLPTQGRDVTAFLELSAGASNLSGGSQVAFAGHGINSNFAEVSLNGARPESTSFTVDGVADNESLFGGISNIPNQLSVQEVKIQTGLYSAEYGQGSGQVNIAIKSGTNTWHGQAYDFAEDSVLQPSSPLTKERNIINGTDNPLKNPFEQNQFGGTLGGPVRIPFLYDGHDKTFWFFSYDGARKTLYTTQTPIQVPTAAERSGNFSDWPYPIYDPATTGSVPATPDDPTGRTPFPQNMIPTNRISALGEKLANLYPLPNQTGCTTLPCDNYLVPVNNGFDTDNETMRVDENLNAKDHFYFTGHIRRENAPNANQLPYTGSHFYNRSELFGVSWERAFSTSSINSFRIGFNRLDTDSTPDTAGGANLQAQLGFANSPTDPLLFGIPAISLGSNYQGIGTNNFGLLNKHNSLQFVDNLKLIRGKHTFTMGADVRLLRERELDNYSGIGSLNFSGKYTASNPAGVSSNNTGADFGNAVADLLLGEVTSLSPPAPLGTDNLSVTGINANVFFQDDIRINSRLTVNLGLRYELPPNYHSVDNSGWNFDPANGGSISWVQQSFVNGVTQEAAAAGLTVYKPYLNCCVPNTLVPIDKKDFAPRIGIAWRPLDTDRFVVRAGYGIFYDTYARYYDLVQNFDDNALQTTFANPNYNSGTGLERTSPEPPLQNLWLPTVGAATFFSTTQPWNPNAFTSPILNQVNWPANRNPYNQQWTLDTQYALRSNLLLDIGYVGQHGLREPTYLAFNTATPPKVPSDNCNYLFDVSQATGVNAACATDPNFQPIDTRVPYSNLPPNFYANANILGSNYNALQMQLRQRFTRGFTYLVSYTWSRTFDELSGIGNVQGNNGFVQNPYDIKADYGPSSFDQPNRLTASGSWDLPVGKGKRWSPGLANWILGDWKISGIYTLTSGRTFSVYGYDGPGYDEMGSPFNGRYRADQSGGATSGFGQSASEWFNTSVFSIAPQGTYGDSAKGSLRGPYFENLDMSFAKMFPITERQHLQFRLDIFNTGSNWHGLNDFFGTNLIPGNTVGSCTFGSLAGIISPTSGCAPDGTTPGAHLWTPRTLQLSLMYSF